MKTPTLVKTFIAASLLITAHSSMAYPKHDPNVYDLGNLWSITFYNDSAPGHTQWATQNICYLPYAVVGTHIRGKWYSTTYPNWHGHYSQEGDSVKMVGNFWGGKGNDGMTFDIVTSSRNNLGAGHWNEWGDNGRFGPVYGFGNALFKRIGYCHKITDFTQADVQIRYLTNGEQAMYPQQRGQEDIKEPSPYEKLFSQEFEIRK
ncbi:hypothetical protein [Thalassomonas actiniarum]|uniref:Uncharacterized protein n=1 Tax=Thalassomonas actiniarum TaxID=485447 RepID=A0AAE9YU29_9GAMM|nr:hypothetical protein [Thalassomonas actiniarum]WDD99641.1 hypothetical protein SG35_002915 [Thalassomonas actiniarum]